MKFESIVNEASACHTEVECEELLMKIRWSNGFHCPRCDHHEAFQIQTRRLLECKECRMQISTTAGTIMHKSKLPLLTWFRAIQMLFEFGAEVTAYALSATLQINYRSAKLLLQKISYALQVEENRLLAFRKLKAARSEEVKPKISVPNVKVNIRDQFEFSTYLASRISEINRKLLLKSLVSIHLYTTFLKCFQL
ncbi:transposase [Paenibacillus qinlingensis]|uniref:Transposase-like protein n=1 Tax=Paenibacillus qinlingensis TaxID=1837343 RepID=A0ABU1NPD9_9BACL|nr:transposase [Paenibacillus qinlingensis]MDR6549323.1 transposase-like protein [Paenibacillus qinlingensis]